MFVGSARAALVRRFSGPVISSLREQLRPPYTVDLTALASTPETRQELQSVFQDLGWEES